MKWKANICALLCILLLCQSAMAISAPMDIICFSFDEPGSWDYVDGEFADGPLAFAKEEPFAMSMYYDASGEPVDIGSAYQAGDYAFSCGFGIIEQDGKFGYIDADGNTVIDCIYDACSPFSEGLASVEKDGENLVIDLTGKTVFNMSQRQMRAYSFSEGLCPVMSTADDESWGLVGYMDHFGDLVIPLQFQSIHAFQENGTAIVDRYVGDQILSGVVDRKGKQVLPLEYKYVYNHYINYILAEDEDETILYDRAGTVLLSLPASEYDSVYLVEDCGLLIVEKNYRYGCLDLEGNVVIPLTYNYVSYIGDGLFSASLPLDHWGVIDKEGNTVIQFTNEFSDAGYSCSEGLLPAECNESGLSGYIDTTGAWVIKPQFEYAQSFKNGYAFVKQNGSLGLLKNPTDLPSVWAQREVEAARELGILSALTDSCYTHSMNRLRFAELMVSLVEHAAGAELDAAEVIPFSDTADIFARKAYAAGIVNGTGDGTAFSPDGTLTREQLATMLCRAVRYIEGETGETILPASADLTGYADADQVSPWAADSMAALTAAGLLQGTSSTTLSPKDTTTVEQGILLALRAYQAFMR